MFWFDWYLTQPHHRTDTLRYNIVMDIFDTVTSQGLLVSLIILCEPLKQYTTFSHLLHRKIGCIANKNTKVPLLGNVFPVIVPTVIHRMTSSTFWISKTVLVCYCNNNILCYVMLMVGTYTVGTFLLALFYKEYRC